MRTISAIQGSEEWKSLRGKYNTASEASIIMGCSKNCTREELLRIKATGDEQEFSRFTEEVIFERGHEVERLARPIAEKIVGDDLFPVTGASDSYAGLLASFDGLTMDETVCWECKQWNQDKAEQVESGKVPKEDYYQVVQQLIVSQAKYCLYMITDGTEENTRTIKVYLDSNHALKLINAWQQFNDDLANYEHVEVKEMPEGKSPDQLPALNIQVTGMVTDSNLDQFKEHALAVFGSINKELSTDEDFANAEKTVKWCQGVEDKLEAAKEQALSQTESIDRLFNTINSIKDEARRVRLDLDKLVKQRKKDVKAEIVKEGQDKLNEHVRKLNEGLGDFLLPRVDADFATAIKGKRNLKSMRDAVSQELANAKIAANEIAMKMSANISYADEAIKDYKFLFSDLNALVQKDADDFKNVVKLRISEHEQAERERKEKERERIRAEEQAKAVEEAAKALKEVGYTDPTKTLVPDSNATHYDDERAGFEEAKIVDVEITDTTAELAKKRYLVTVDWSGYSTGYTVYEVVAESEEEAKEDYSQHIVLDHVTVRDDTEKEVARVELA